MPPNGEREHHRYSSENDPCFYPVYRESNAGRHVAQWHGRNSNDRPVASGVYLHRLESGSQSETRRMVLVK